MKKMEEKVFEEGKAKWPELSKDDGAGVVPVMSCFGGDLSGSSSCGGCGYRIACDKTRARGDMKEVAFATIYGGPPSSVEESLKGVVCAQPQVYEDFQRETIAAVVAKADELCHEEGSSATDPEFFSCDCFEPQRVALLIMSPSYRPSKNCIRELDRQMKYEEFIKEQWEKLAAKKLKEWKVENSHDLPRCHEHEGRWGLEGNKEVQVSLETKILLVKHSSGRLLTWMRRLWLVCPGAPKGADRRSKPIL